MAFDGVSTAGDTHMVGQVSPSQTAGAAPSKDTPQAASRAQPVRRLGPITVGRLKWVSFTHSCIYTALLVCAFVLSKPEPLTFVLGMTHGLLWIGMSLICIVCARLRVVSLRLAVAVAVLGGIGPFFGSYEFVREQRRHPPQVARNPVGEV
jgi:hypothetical protein